MSTVFALSTSNTGTQTFFANAGIELASVGSRKLGRVAAQPRRIAATTVGNEAARAGEPPMPPEP